MGHRDVALTLRQYVHPDAEGKRAAVDTLHAYGKVKPAKNA